MANGEAISPGREVRDSPEIREVWHKPNGRTMSNISAISHQTMKDESTSFTKEWLEVMFIYRRNKTHTHLKPSMHAVGYLLIVQSASVKKQPK